MALEAYRQKLGKYPLKVTGKLSAHKKAYATLATSIPKADPRVHVQRLDLGGTVVAH